MSQILAHGLGDSNNILDFNRKEVPSNLVRELGIQLGGQAIRDLDNVGKGIYQVQLTALDPREEKGQIDLFNEINSENHRLNRVIDSINQRYGDFTLASANLLNRSDMPNVISPAWKPYGCRQTIFQKYNKNNNVVKKVFKIE